MNRALILALALGGCASNECRQYPGYEAQYATCVSNAREQDRARAQRMANAYVAPPPAAVVYETTPQRRMLSTSPPAAPGPMPIPNRDTPRATTWMDTPYAPQVMPVWRGTPVP